MCGEMYFKVHLWEMRQCMDAKLGYMLEDVQCMMYSVWMQSLADNFKTFLLLTRLNPSPRKLTFRTPFPTK